MSCINNYTMVDLFCGAGIGAVGFKQAGYNIIDAIDNKDYAVKTYNLNIGNHARIADIKELDSNNMPYADVYTGGFPCTPFSVAGKRNGVEDEEKGDLGWHFLRLVSEKQPKVFVLENVKGLISKKNISFFNSLISAFEESGYKVNWKLINMYDYGIPQMRERVIAVGVRNDLHKEFVFPDPLPETSRKNLFDAIGDLPEKPDGINNHKGYGIRKDEKPYIDKILDGGNWKDLPEQDQKDFMKGSYYCGGGRTGYLRKMRMDKPALTITSNMNGKFNAQIIDRGGEARRFTVRECLRIQSVPDWFKFPEDISLQKQYERCSGIPSQFTYLLGNKIKEMLDS